MLHWLLAGGVYYPPPTYVYDPYAPLVAFGAGIAVGAIIWNECDWHHGGVYVGHHGTVVWSSGDYHHGDVDVDVDRNVNVNNVNRENRPASGTQPARPKTPQKWQPDQRRLQSSSTLGASGTARTLESRGWTSGGARPATSPGTGSVAARPSTGTVATRPSTGSVAARPAVTPSTTRPAPSYAGSGTSSRPSGSGSRGSAFGGLDSGSNTRTYSNRGYSSRSGGGSRGGSRGGRGGGRGR